MVLERGDWLEVGHCGHDLDAQVLSLVPLLCLLSSITVLGQSDYELNPLKANMSQNKSVLL